MAQALSPLALQFRSGDASCLATTECPVPQRPPRCGSAPEVPRVRLPPHVGSTTPVAPRLRTGDAACLATTRPDTTTPVALRLRTGGAAFLVTARHRTAHCPFGYGRPQKPRKHPCESEFVTWGGVYHGRRREVKIFFTSCIVSHLVGRHIRFSNRGAAPGWEVRVAAEAVAGHPGVVADPGHTTCPRCV